VEATLTSFQERLQRPWLADPGQAARFAEVFRWHIAKLNASGSGAVVVSAAERVDFLAGAWAAIAQRREVFLLNPEWGEAERTQAGQRLPRQAVWLDEPPWLEARDSPDPTFFPEYAGGIMIATGGSGGGVKFAVHTWPTLSAAVDGYQRFWNRPVLHAVCPLPVCHIGGLMLALRTWMTGGRLWLTGPRLETAPPTDFPLGQAHVSVVGAQLKRALGTPGHWLARCGATLAGGGPCASSLITRAREAGVSLHLAYGLTEAAATVALAPMKQPPSPPKPDADARPDGTRSKTLRSESPSRDDGSPGGEILPHWRVIAPEETIVLSGPALFRGYWGETPRGEGPWRSGDRGQLTPEGRLKVLGRWDRIIVTGGKKVDADALEKQLASWNEVADAIVWAEDDEQWGQRVVAAVVSSNSAEELTTVARGRLAAESRPKRWVVVDHLQRRANGKPNWEALTGIRSGNEQKIGDRQRADHQE